MRQVPKDIPWYRRHVAQMFMSGFLPFSAIYIELHYIFASIWGHQIYTMFGILILAFGLLLIVCSFITVKYTQQGGPPGGGVCERAGGVGGDQPSTARARAFRNVHKDT